MSDTSQSTMTTGQLATLACVLEVTIPKPGNVHRAADFADTGLLDFLVSAVAIGPAMDAASENSLGDTVFSAMTATRRQVAVNTNLGIVLLFAPLATVKTPDSDSVQHCLAATDVTDCRKYFQAISDSKPGGLGQVTTHDVGGDDLPANILTAMREAANRDMIARQYDNGYRDVFEFVLPAIEFGLAREWSISDAVIHAHLTTMYEFPDSLIARKNGQDLANQSAARAGKVLDAGNPGDDSYLKAIGDLDFWLRSDGNRRNPGTTADLIAAALFVGLLRGTIDIRENRS